MKRRILGCSALYILQHVDTEPNNHQSQSTRQSNSSEPHSGISTTRRETVRRTVVWILLQVRSGLHAGLVDRSRASQDGDILKMSRETLKRYTSICQFRVACAHFSLVGQRKVGRAALDTTGHTTICRCENDISAGPVIESHCLIFYSDLTLNSIWVGIACSIPDSPTESSRCTIVYGGAAYDRTVRVQENTLEGRPATAEYVARSGEVASVDIAHNSGRDDEVLGL